jgi:hypothetical protein
MALQDTIVILEVITFFLYFASSTLLALSSSTLLVQLCLLLDKAQTA